VKQQISKRIDWLILGTALALCFLGVLFIRSSSWRVQDSTYAPYPQKQIVFIVVSVLFLLVTLRISYMYLARMAFGIYFAGIMMLLAVPVIGKTIYGARRWIDFGPFDLQPSELVKIALILTLARFLMYRSGGHRFSSVLGPLLITFFPLILILKQPDFGTSMVLLPICFGMLYASGAKLKYLISIGIVGLMLLVPMWKFGLKQYQKDRILAFIYPELDPLGRGYQTNQSMIAVGSGGWTGKGIAKGTQNRLNKLPQRHTDFIFAVIAEEWGFMGSSLVIFLYVILLMLIARVAIYTREPFGRLVAVGVMMLFASQIFVNIGMAVRLMPVTGLTLPFISYGGSSLVTSFVGLALVMSIEHQEAPELSGKVYRW